MWKLSLRARKLRHRAGRGVGFLWFERGGDCLLDAFEPDELDLFPRDFRNVVVVLAVARRQHDPLDAGAVRADHLLLDAADREHQPAQADFAGHRGIAAHGAIGHQRYQRHEHGDAGARPVFRDRACRDVDMDVALLEAAGVNAKSGGAVLHDRKRGLHAFAHDLAELAGQDELARARHPRRFNEEDIAADRRPGEPRSDARHARSHCGFAFELRRPDDRGKIATRDPDRAVLAFGNAHRGMAQHLPDLAFETPHAGFARIALNDVAQRLVVDFDLAGFEPVGLRLATDQIAMRDLELLLGGVARERDYFHSVA